MNINNLKPVSECSANLGVKSIIYGEAGTGKTPLSATCPNPVMCATESGLLSLRNVNNLPTWEAYDANKVDEFFKWFLSSKEASNFDTLVIDSLSQLAEIYLKDELARNKDGRMAYGKMADKVMDLLYSLYYKPNLHLYIICKMGTFDDNGTHTKRPYFPGQELNVKVKHLMDEIFYISETNIPGVPKPQLAIRTKSTYGILARDRSGKLNELEPPNMANIFNKCMS